MAKLASSRPVLQGIKQHDKQQGHRTAKDDQRLHQPASQGPIGEETEQLLEDDDIGAKLEDKILKAVDDLELWWKNAEVSHWKQTRRLRQTKQILPVLESHTKALACLRGTKPRCVGQWKRMARVMKIIKRSDKVVKRGEVVRNR